MTVPPRSSDAITVICPTYNCESYIQETLESVFLQTQPPAELIVVDDGSTDNTCTVVRQLVSTSHPSFPVRLFVRTHLGPGATRNFGISQSRTSWISFLDSDDLWHPEKLQYIQSAIASFPNPNFITHNENLLTDDGEITPLNLSDLYFRSQPPLTKSLFKVNYFSTSAVSLNIELLRTHGMFDPTLMSCQDYELWLRLAPFLSPLYLEEYLGTYRQRSGNITSSRPFRRLLNEAKVLIRYRAYASPPLFLFRFIRLLSSHSAALLNKILFS